MDWSKISPHRGVVTSLERPGSGLNLALTGTLSLISASEGIPASSGFLVNYKFLLIILLKNALTDLAQN